MLVVYNSLILTIESNGVTHAYTCTVLGSCLNEHWGWNKGGWGNCFVYCKLNILGLLWLKGCTAYSNICLKAET